MKKILLTGGTGYIGSHCAVELLDEGYDVVVVDNLSNSKIEVVDRINQITKKKIKFYQGDCRDYSLMDKIFKEEEIEAVIHLAGLKAVGQSVKQPLDYYENNINATITLLKAMLENEVYNLVFSSSATVYDPTITQERLETMKLWCSNPYGFTKVFSEQIIRDCCNANGKLKAINLRYFNPVGAHNSYLIGEDCCGMPNNLMPYIQLVATGKMEYLKVYGDDYNTVDGTGMRDYIHVVDLAKAHLAALKYMLTQMDYGCDDINIGTGKATSVLQLVRTFEKVNNVSIPYKVVERRKGDIDILYANTSKAENILHWKAKLTLEDMCKDSYNWQVSLQKNQ